jgi:hypothetical protein
MRGGGSGIIGRAKACWLRRDDEISLGRHCFPILRTPHLAFVRFDKLKSSPTPTA